MRMQVQLRSPKSTFKVETDTALNISGGYDDGFNEGFSQGKTEGFAEGEAIGYEKGESAGYQSGYAEGDSAGYSRGYGEGETEGYNNGYNKGVEDTTPSGEIELTENNKTYDVAKYASAKVNIAGIEDLTTVLNEQDALIAELKSLLAQKAKLGDAKLPSLVGGTNVELTAEDLAGVTAIRNYAFHYASNLTSIILPESVTKIGRYSFDNCRYLVSITLPNNLTDIGTYAFQSCSSLAGIVTISGLCSIGNNAFQNCTKITRYILRNGVKSLSMMCFAYNYLLECIDLTDCGSDGAFPSLASTSAFTSCGISTALGTFEIRVPAGRKAELAAMTNWSTYADNIVEVS